MITAKKLTWMSPAEDMAGWFMFCFKCNIKIANKSLIRRNHINHDVDWVRKSDSKRYMFMPDGTVPKMSVEDGLS